MAAKKIIITPKSLNIFFRVELFDGNSAYTWSFTNTFNGTEIDYGAGDSQDHNLVKLSKTDTKCIGKSITFRYASDNIIGAYTRISIYQGKEADNSTLIGSFEPKITANPILHRIDFVKE